MLSLLHHSHLLVWMLRWTLIAAFIGVTVGSGAAAFLYALVWSGQTRGEHLPWMLLLLGPAGAVVALIYEKWGGRSERGNNLIIDELHDPTEPLPLRMAPLVVGGTLISHLFGASAGREGTAVQMGAVFADQLSRPFKFDGEGRKVLLAAGVAAGFSALFGTPLAGAVFGLEVLMVGGILYHAILPTLFSALLADWVCRLWEAPHAHYHVGDVPGFSGSGFFWAVLAGIAFGLCASLFSLTTKRLSAVMKRYVQRPWLRPLIGAFVIGALFLAFGEKYLGLGLPTIVRSFHTELPAYAFMVKLVFTVVTLAAGFKGGEVTPLFFIGAALGNALSFVIPGLPMDLLVAMGFVGVFAGAANTPLACIFMAVELFGADCLGYVSIACVTAYLFSGHTGIYGAQRLRVSKLWDLKVKEGSKLSDLDNL